MAGGQAVMLSAQVFGQDVRRCIRLDDVQAVMSGNKEAAASNQVIRSGADKIIL